MFEPFEPQIAIINGELYLGSFFFKISPALSLILLSSPFKYDSKVYSLLHPAFKTNSPFLYYSINLSQFLYPASTRAYFSLINSPKGVTSLMPIDIP